MQAGNNPLRKTFALPKLGITVLGLGVICAFTSSAMAESLVVASARKANDNGTNTHFFAALNDGGIDVASIQNIGDEQIGQNYL